MQFKKIGFGAFTTKFGCLATSATMPRFQTKYSSKYESIYGGFPFFTIHLGYPHLWKPYIHSVFMYSSGFFRVGSVGSQLMGGFSVFFTIKNLQPRLVVGSEKSFSFLRCKKKQEMNDLWSKDSPWSHLKFVTSTAAPQNDFGLLGPFLVPGQSV